MAFNEFYILNIPWTTTGRHIDVYDIIMDDNFPLLLFLTVSCIMSLKYILWIYFEHKQMRIMYQQRHPAVWQTIILIIIRKQWPSAFDQNYFVLFTIQFALILCNMFIWYYIHIHIFMFQYVFISNCFIKQ